MEMPYQLLLDRDHRDEMEQEAAGSARTDMSNAMMTMAFAMGDWGYRNRHIRYRQPKRTLEGII